MIPRYLVMFVLLDILVIARSEPVTCTFHDEEMRAAAAAALHSRVHTGSVWETRRRNPAV